MRESEKRVNIVFYNVLMSKEHFPFIFKINSFLPHTTKRL